MKDVMLWPLIMHALCVHPQRTKAAKASRCFSQTSLLAADSCQHAHPQCFAYLLRASSHLNQRSRQGRVMRKDRSNNSSVRHHAESLQTVALTASRSDCMRWTCPAHVHLAFRCASAQKRTLHLIALSLAIRDDRCLYSN